MKKFFVWLSLFTLGFYFYQPQTAFGQDQATGMEQLIEAGDHEIPAIETFPQEPGPHPVVVLIHSNGSDKDGINGGFIKLATLLADIGIATIRFDLAGSGDSSQEDLDFTLTGAVEDTEAILKYIQDQPELYNADSIGLVGWDEGASIAMLVAGNHDIAAMVTWSPVADLSVTLSEEDIKQAQEEGYFVRKYPWGEERKFSQAYVEEVLNTNVLESFTKYSGPIMNLYSPEDEFTTGEDLKKIYDSNGHEDSFGVNYGEDIPSFHEIFMNEDGLVRDVITGNGSWFKGLLNTR